MSRYCGDKGTAPVLSAGDHWRKECLEKEASVFSIASLWTMNNLGEVKKYFVNQQDEGEGNFQEKLKVQLEAASSATKQLVSEMMWLMLLCPDNIGFNAKLDAIRPVWDWSGQPFPEDSRWTKPDVLNGIGSGGVSYHILRWRELAFFTGFMTAF
jgi:5-methylcytosine-specific restriction enzyme B